MDEVSRRLVCQRSNIGSRVNREVHARFWERPGVRFLRATRQTRKKLRVSICFPVCPQQWTFVGAVGSRLGGSTGHLRLS